MTYCPKPKDASWALDRGTGGSCAAVTAVTEKPKKDESHKVNISDITAERELRQPLQTDPIKYSRRSVYSLEKRGPLRIC